MLPPTFGTSSPVEWLRSLISGYADLRQHDGDELVDLIYKYYPQLDAKYKGLIPLRQVYIPETLTE